MTLNVTLRTPKATLSRGLVNNSTCTTFANPVPTETLPATVDSETPTSNSVVIPISGEEIHLFPFGTDADNETLNLRVFLWQRLGSLWIPSMVGGFVATLSSTVNGVAEGDILDTEFFADTITEEGSTWDDATAPATVRVRNPANDTLAAIVVRTQGYEFLEVRFDLGTAAAGNVAFTQR